MNKIIKKCPFRFNPPELFLIYNNLSLSSYSSESPLLDFVTECTS